METKPIPVVTLDQYVKVGNIYYAHENLYEAFKHASELVADSGVAFHIETALFDIVNEHQYVYIDQVNHIYHVFTSKDADSMSPRFLVLSTDNPAYAKTASSKLERWFKLDETIYTEECFQ